MKKPVRLRRASFAPVFCPVKTDMEAAPLSPKELANPSTLAAAVYAVMAPAPRPFTVPWTRSLPTYRLHMCRADTRLNRVISPRSRKSQLMSARRKTRWTSRRRR